MEQKIIIAYREFLRFGARYEIVSDSVMVSYNKSNLFPPDTKKELKCDTMWVHFCKNYVVERK